MSDEKQIRTLIENWFAAVAGRDLDGVTTRHTADMVMYDVPGPSQATRDLDGYRDTWPPFFDWQRRGAVFELKQLDVTAGTDVAFAHALVHCEDAGTPDDAAKRLRITFGLRTEDGEWRIAHEHHSFPDDSLTEQARDEQALRKLHEDWSAATAAKDLDALMAPIADDVVSYEHQAPLEFRGVDAVRESCRLGLEAGPEASFEIPDLQLVVRDDLAVGWGLNRTAASLDGRTEESWSRGTRVFRRDAGGRWRMVHQHVSFPLDPESGQSRTDLRPA